MKADIEDEEEIRKNRIGDATERMKRKKTDSRIGIAGTETKALNRMTGTDEEMDGKRERRATIVEREEKASRMVREDAAMTDQRAVNARTTEEKETEVRGKEGERGKIAAKSPTVIGELEETEVRIPKIDSETRTTEKTDDRKSIETERRTEMRALNG